MSEITSSPDALITISQLARVLEYSEQWTRTLVDLGRIPSLRTENGTRLARRGDGAAYRAGHPPRRRADHAER